jgi:hypothetical protein
VKLCIPRSNDDSKHAKNQINKQTKTGAMCKRLGTRKLTGFTGKVAKGYVVIITMDAPQTSSSPVDG